MNGLYRMLLLSVLCLGTLPHRAAAEDPGLYIGGMAGISFGDFKDDAQKTLDSVTTATRSFANLEAESTKAAWKILAGYQVNQHVGFEFAYASYGERSYSYDQTLTPVGDDPVTGRVTLEGALDAITYSMILRYPLSERFEPFVRVGGASWEGHVDVAGRTVTADGTNFLLGVGVEYEWFDKVGLRAEWERILVDQAAGADINMISVGVEYDLGL